MYSKLTICLLLACALSARADENFPILTVGRTTYTNVTVTLVTATDIYFTYSAGMANARIGDLSPDLQKHFHYNEARAKTAEQRQAEANVQYRDVVVRQGTARPPAEGTGPSPSPAAQARQSSAQWLTDLPTALNQARTDNKLVLMDFTGSDWCPWCMKLDHDVFSTSQFDNYARKNLVLVRVDFPRNTPQSADLKQANKLLSRRFHVTGYPTCILLDVSGNELGRQVGYLEGGPDAFLAELDGFSKK